MAQHAAAAPAGHLILALLALVISVWPAVAVMESSVTLWSSVLPNVAVPAALLSSVSPVEDCGITNRFANAVKRGAVFPSMSSAFCSAGGLVCDSNVEISAYGAETVEAAPRAASIKTVNDLQFDFFLEEKLVVGGEMRLSENLHDPIPMRPFLPTTVANSLPALTTANMPKLRQTFNIERFSSMATMMGTAAYLCENPALPGEDKDCTLTLPAMARFVYSQLGAEVQALSTTGAPAHTPSRKAPVVIERVTKGSLAQGEHIVVCHTLMFPSALYYCHHVSGTKVVQASLRAHDGTLINAIGICHMDTSLWASEHPAFKALNIPRGAEACHWLVQNDVVWMAAGTQ